MHFSAVHALPPVLKKTVCTQFGVNSIYLDDSPGYIGFLFGTSTVSNDVVVFRSW